MKLSGDDHHPLPWQRQGLARSIERSPNVGLEHFYNRLERQSAPINKSGVVNQKEENGEAPTTPIDTHTQRAALFLRPLFVAPKFLMEQFSGGVFQHKKQQVGGAVFNWNKRFGWNTPGQISGRTATKVSLMGSHFHLTLQIPNHYFNYN
jgi:hypothetical protein